MKQVSNWKKVVLSCMVVLGMVTMLSGCGSTKEVSQQENQAKVLHIGTNAAYPPMEFTKPNSTDIDGFDHDLMEAIGKRIGYKIEWTNMGFDGLIPALQSGQLDGVIAGMNITDERKKAVLFSDPYYYTSSVIMHKKGDGIHSIQDLAGKTVAVQIGTAEAKQAKTFPGVTVKELNNIPNILDDIKAGGAQATLVDAPLAAYYGKLSGGQFESFAIDNNKSPIGIAFSKKNAALVEAVNQALAEMKKDGEYEKIYQKWFGNM